jgi:hypothetical protein
MHGAKILQYLTKNGQKLDLEIATGMRIPIREVRSSLSALMAKGEIHSCKVTKFNGGKKIEGMLCRISGTTPPATPGRKSINLRPAARVNRPAEL